MSCNVLSQMGAQQGFAGGPSPGSKMLIMNINKSSTHTAHAHIPLWLQHLSVLLSRHLFLPPFFTISSMKKPGITTPPGQHLVSLVVFLSSSAVLHEKSISIICYSPSSLHFMLSLSLSPLLNLSFSRILFFAGTLYRRPPSFLRVGLLSREWNPDCGYFFSPF